MHWILVIIAIYFLFAPPHALPAPDNDAYRRALPGYEFEFPRDHGAHPEFRTEWWYYTGNVRTAEGRPFGYELTIFRTALEPPGGERLEDGSPLAASQLYLGHFAISDIENRRHDSWERIGRAGFGQARASTERLDIQLGGWTVEMDGNEVMRLRAAEDHGGLELTLAPAKPLVIHGEDGAHKKAGDVGQASHYISYTRLETTGILRWEGEEHEVAGLSWMDHEFGSAWLGEEETGWDWFALQLDTGDDVMVYQLRRRDGTFTPNSSGSIVDPLGNRQPLTGTEYEIEATGSWESPRTGAVYPMGWIIRIPSEEADLHVIPAFEDQEMRTDRWTGAVYWEGAIRVEGHWRGEPVTGAGYVELVGYAEEFTLL